MGSDSPKNSDLFLRTARGEAVERAPVWIMRQAGRYLPEYREIKARYDFLTLCKTPELAAEVTLQPVRRLGVDAAILFSDILVPVEPMGIGVRFDPGPILDRAINTEAAIASLRPVDAEESCGFVLDAIRILRRELRVPLIGFAGAPFTVAAYLAEERGRKPGAFDAIVRMIFEAPDLARRLLSALTDVMAGYLSAQIRAGAQAVQIFDSWAGILGRREFEDFALAAAQEVIARLPSPRGPVIYFVPNGAHLLDLLPRSGADVIGVDWRTPLSEARRAIDADPARLVALQGNLDPRALFASRERLREEVERVLREGRGPGGHVFNLGHGILPDTTVEAAQALVEDVREISQAMCKGAAGGSAAAV